MKNKGVLMYLKDINLFVSEEQKPKKSFLRRIIDKRKKEKLTRLKKELDNLKDDGTLHAAVKEKVMAIRILVNEIDNPDSKENSVDRNMKN